MTKKPIAAIVALLVAGGLLGWTLGKSGKDKAVDTPSMSAAPAAPLVGMSEVTEQRLVTRTKMGGYVEPRDVVHLTAQAGGRVMYLVGREGTAVQAGQVVVGLDEDRQMADYRSAWAQLSGEMAGIQNAQVQLYNKINGPTTSPMGGPLYDAYDRSATPFYNMFQQAMPFFGGGQPMMPQSAQQNSYANRSQSRSEYERQQAGVVSAQTRVDAAEAQLRDRRSIAPYPAIILAKFVNLGDVVQPGQALVDLAQTNQMNLKLNLPTRLVMQLRPGAMVPVVLEGNVTVQGMIEQIAPGANPVQHTVAVKIALPPDAPAAPGMYASALLPEPAAAGEVVRAPMVPASALVYRGSLPSIFVVGSNGQAELRIVRVGETQGDRVVVLSGVSAGEKVVTAPTQSMHAGDPLYPPQP